MDTTEHFAYTDKFTEALPETMDDDAKAALVKKLIKSGAIFELLEPEARNFDNTPVKGKPKNCEASDGT